MEFSSGFEFDEFFRDFQFEALFQCLVNVIGPMLKLLAPKLSKNIKFNIVLEQRERKVYIIYNHLK